MRLELIGGRAKIVPLGRLLLNLPVPDNLTLPGFPSYGDPGLDPVAQVSDTATRLYFPSTRHTLQGDLLHYWQAHGGQAVFGAPLTEVFSAPNGDGTGGSYQMQLFENARLERHPESHGPRYAILLGFLGSEGLLARGWTILS